MADTFTFQTVSPSQASFTARRSPAVQISRRLNDTPDNASYVSTIDVIPGQNVDIDFADSNGSHFKGIAQRVDWQLDPEYDRLTTPLEYNTTLVDYTWLLNRRRPIACYDRISATTIVLDLMSRFTTGFTVTGVAASLPAASGIFSGSTKLSEALSYIAKLIGARWYLNVKDLVFKITEETVQPDDLTDTNTDLLRDSPISLSKDISQISNRVFGRGVGVSVVQDAFPGDTAIWIEGVEAFTVEDPITGFHNSLGPGQMISDCQIFSYTGAEIIFIPVNRGITPSNPTTTPIITTPGNIKVQSQYKIAAIREGTGETELGAETTGPLWTSYRTTAASFGATNPTDGGFCTGNVPAGTKRYLLAWKLTDGTLVNDVGATNAMKEIDSFGSTIFTSLPTAGISANGVTPDLRIASKVLLRTKIGDTSVYYEVDEIPLATTNFTDVLADTSLGDLQPAVNYGGIKVSITGLPDTATRIGFKIYRSDFVGSAYQDYKLLDTVMDKTTETYIDNVAEVDAGEDVPGPPPPIIRTILFDIPSSGAGSLTTHIKTGSTINLYAMEEDVAAQADLAQHEGDDGIHESEVTGLTNLITIQDLRARLRAELALFAWPIQTLTYSTRDRKTKPGCRITVNLTHPPITGLTLKIQSVDIDQLHEADNLKERYRVMASSILFTLDDLLRKVLR